MRTACLTLIFVVQFPWIISAQENILQAVAAARAAYPTPMSKQQLGEMLNQAAWDGRNLGYALLGKPEGNNCPSPAGVPIACDFLVHVSGNGFDVLIDQEGDALPTWQGPHDLRALIASGARSIVLPVDPNPPPPVVIPDPGTNPPTPAPVVTDDDVVEQQILDKLTAVEKTLIEHDAQAREFQKQVGIKWSKIAGFFGKYIAPLVGGVWAGWLAKGKLAKE